MIIVFIKKIAVVLRKWLYSATKMVVTKTVLTKKTVMKGKIVMKCDSPE